MIRPFIRGFHQQNRRTRNEGGQTKVDTSKVSASAKLGNPFTRKDQNASWETIRFSD